MESQHGKWTLSDSDDDEDNNNVVPPTPPKDIKKPLKNIKADPEPKASPVNTLFKPKSEPRKDSDVNLETEKPPVLPTGSEARQAVHVYQNNSVKNDSGPSPALKRKRETDEGGWNLSSSSDDDGAPSSAPEDKPKPKAPTSSPPRKKPERSRPPSPHGDHYYKEEPSDFFEASLNTMNDTYRFYLNKVTGIEKKYNTGALHIKGNEYTLIFETTFVAYCMCITAAPGYIHSLFPLLSLNRNTFPHVWHAKGIRSGTFLLFTSLTPTRDVTMTRYDKHDDCTTQNHSISFKTLQLACVI